MLVTHQATLATLSLFLGFLEIQATVVLRDEIYELNTMLAGDEGLKPRERIKVMAGEEQVKNPAKVLNLRRDFPF